MTLEYAIIGGMNLRLKVIFFSLLLVTLLGCAKLHHRGGDHYASDFSGNIQARLVWHDHIHDGKSCLNIYIEGVGLSDEHHEKNNWFFTFLDKDGKSLSPENIDFHYGDQVPVEASLSTERKVASYGQFKLTKGHISTCLDEKSLSQMSQIGLHSHRSQYRRGVNLKFQLH